MNHEFEGEDDFLDPEVVRRAQEVEDQDVETLDAKVRQFLARRQAAYKRVFASSDPSDIKLVMADLMEFCRVMRPTWDANGKRQDLLEGRREVFLRIASHTRLDFDTLFLMYTDALTKMEK